MRPGQNRRMRGRSRSKGPNPLTRSYESNGPDVKIRGTAQHIADKYAQLARDATASGDPVAAENYLQHAEHYYRLIAAAQETYRQQFGVQARPFDDESEEGDEEGPNGYPYQPERGMQGGGDEFGDMGGQPPYETRQGGGERQPQQGRFDRGERQDRGDRQDRGFDRSAERQGGGERQDRNQRFDRNGERFDRNANGYEGRNGNRPQGERFDRNGGGYQQNNERFDRQDRPERQERPDRFARGENRENGRDGGRREFNRDRGQPRPDGGRYPAQQPDEREAPAAGLPAFLTTPVRSTIALGEEDRSGDVEAAPAFEPENGDEPGLNGAPEPRPRRARRPRRPEAPEGLDFGSAGADKPVD